MLMITGATGHSGSIFLENLDKEQYQGMIKCLVRRGSDVERLQKYSLNLSYVYADLDNLNDLQAAMIGVETVLHIAGIQYSREIVRAGALAKVPWMILIHTTGRYSKFKSASRFYIEVEEELIERYKNLTILRPTMIYGSSRDKNMWQLINFLDRFRFFPIFGDGKNLMQPVCAIDLAKAYQSIVEKKDITYGKQYNLSGKEPISYNELLKTVEEELGKKILLLHVPITICICIVWIYNKIFGKKSLVSVEQVLRMKEDKAFSWNDAWQDFEYSPISFREGIKEEIKELRESDI